MAVRKSSRGNPYHDERGRFCSGPRSGKFYTVSERTPEEYAERTKERKAKTWADLGMEQQEKLLKDKKVTVDNINEKILVAYGFVDANSYSPNTDENGESCWIKSWWSSDGYEILMASDIIPGTPPKTIVPRTNHCVLVAPDGRSCECANVNEAMSVKAGKCPKCGASLKRMKCTHCGYPNNRKLHWETASMTAVGQSFKGTHDGNFTIYDGDKVFAFYDSQTQNTTRVDDYWSPIRKTLTDKVSGSKYTAIYKKEDGYYIAQNPFGGYQVVCIDEYEGRIVNLGNASFPNEKDAMDFYDYFTPEFSDKIRSNSLKIMNDHEKLKLLKYESKSKNFKDVAEFTDFYSLFQYIMQL